MFVWINNNFVHFTRGWLQNKSFGINNLIILLQFWRQRVLEMTTVFKKTLMSILILGKLLGFMNFSYTIKSTEILIQYSNSTYYSFLEFSRTCVLLICAYISQSKGFFYLRTIDLLKFWVVIIAARISQLWTIKYDIIVDPTLK